MQSLLFYVHDPMCSWCWGFRPVWEEITRRLPPRIGWQRLLGGLAPDTEEPMPEATRKMIQGAWRTIEQQIPGTPFNFDFWDRCQPRRATYPACRAVIAARAQGGEYQERMILAVQQAYYLQARNPSDDQVLLDLAGEIGLDRHEFGQMLNLESIQFELDREIALARMMGVRSFPGLVLATGDGVRRIEHDYRDPAAVLVQLEATGALF